MAAMNLINVENITKSYTDSLLFDEASFTVDEQEKVGIIGINRSRQNNTASYESLDWRHRKRAPLPGQIIL